MAALNFGINFSGVLIALASAGILYALGIDNWLGLWGSIVIGLVVGIAIGKVTEYYTSFEFKPVKFIAENATTGPATVIISGIGVGMISTLGLTLATDAYGPISDNAGGNAEISALGDDVRSRTDALDALGSRILPARP